jgi:hypothetical protein
MKDKTALEELLRSVTSTTTLTLTERRASLAACWSASVPTAPTPQRSSGRSTSSMRSPRRWRASSAN